MKSLGFLTVLATVIVVVTAQNQIVASAQANVEAIAGAAAKGARVIHVPAGSTIYHKPPHQVPRSAPNKPAQATAGAQSTATAKAGAAKNAPGHPHKGGSHPQPYHPAHHPKHVNPPQKQAVATATAQATAVAKTPKKSDSKKPLEPLALLKDIPSEFKLLIDAVLAESPLIKAGIDIITGLVDTEKNTVPLIIAGINTGVKDLVDTLLSPKSVNKAVKTIAGLPDKVVKQVVAKIGELLVAHADKIQKLLKALVDAGHLAKAAAVGLSVVATLGAILQNEIFSKIPTDISNLDKLPIPLDKLPIPLDKLPKSLDKLPTTLSELLSPLDKLLEPLEKELQKKLNVSGGQGGEVPAHAGTSAQAVAGDATGAAAQAGSAAAAVAEEEIPEDSEDLYEDEEEASAEAAASASAAAVAHAG